MEADSVSQVFLTHLDPDANFFTFQTVPEPKGKRTHLRPQVLHGSLHELLPDLTRLNRQGAGIYVTVNETDGKARKAENITRIRAIWQDDDYGYGGGFPLPPSMVVSTSPGKFQRYWLAECLSKEDFRVLMTTLVKDYGCDKRAVDIARVLRVPGFFHNKGQPHLVTLIEASGKKYTRDELLRAFPSPEQAPPPPGSGVREDIPFAAAATLQSVDENSFRINRALKLLSPDPYDQWIKVGQILHDAYDGQAEGLYLWMGWAQTSSKFDANEHTCKWGTFGKTAGRKLRLGTLFMLADEALYGG